MLKLIKVAGPLVIGFGLLTLQATAAGAEPVRQDRPEHGKVIMCAVQDQAQMAELEGNEYACTVGPARFVVVQVNAGRKRNG